MASMSPCPTRRAYAARARRRVNAANSSFSMCRLRRLRCQGLLDGPACQGDGCLAEVTRPVVHHRAVVRAMRAVRYACWRVVMRGVLPAELGGVGGQVVPVASACRVLSARGRRGRGAERRAAVPAFPAGRWLLAVTRVSGTAVSRSVRGGLRRTVPMILCWARPHPAGRNAAHCPDWPLQRQGHPKIVSNRFAETIFRTRP